MVGTKLKEMLFTNATAHELGGAMVAELGEIIRTKKDKEIVSFFGMDSITEMASTIRLMSNKDSVYQHVLGPTLLRLNGILQAHKLQQR